MPTTNATRRQTARFFWYGLRNCEHEGNEERRVELRRPSGQALHRRDIALEQRRHGGIDEGLGERVQLLGALALGDGLVVPSLEGQRHAELVVRERVVGIERDDVRKSASGSSSLDPRG